MNRAVLLAAVGLMLLPRATGAQALPKDPETFAGRAA
jgi:hypothetical protein